MRKLVSVVLALILLFSLGGCKSAPSKQKFTDYSFDCFDTVTTIVGFEQSKEEFDAACDMIKAELQSYHKLYTIYTRYEGVENLCTLNRAFENGGEPVAVDRKIVDMLLYAKEMYQKTNGKLNVALGSVLSIWHQYREAGLSDPAAAVLPPMTALTAAADHTSIEDLVVDDANGTVYFADPALKLDVGAIAKGYAVEQVAKMMAAEGLSGYLLNVGGNVRIVGDRPDGKTWTVGIENPDTDNKESPYIAYLSLGEMSLVTSGSYQRYYMVDGKSYHHIIDPATLMPAAYFQSVSVLCRDSGRADAFSTALFSMSYEEGAALVENAADLEAMWVLPDGTQKYSSGFAAYCKE